MISISECPPRRNGASEDLNTWTANHLAGSLGRVELKSKGAVMNKAQVVSIVAMLALAGSLGAGASLAAGDTQSPRTGNSQPPAFGHTGNQGEGFSEDQTIKGKGRNPDSSIGQDAQITLGGARPVVEGQVLNVRGDDYIIKDSSGSEVRVRVNKDTNMDCGTGSGQDTTLSTGRQADDQAEIPPTSHMQERITQQTRQSGSHEQKGQERLQQSKGGHASSDQQSGERVGDKSGTQSRSAMGKDSGGDIARGSGFTLGSKGRCIFKTGDQVRAEVSDLGTVLYIKTISDEARGSQQRGSGQMLPESQGMTPGERASAQQRAQMMKPGSVPAPLDEQTPDLITRDGKQMANAEPQLKNACDGCKIVRGLVLSSDSKSLLVKDASQKEVRLKLDQATRMGTLSQPLTGTFVEGDRIEAYVRPDGVAWSITALKQQQGQPGVAGAPGD